MIPVQCAHLSQDWSPHGPEAAQHLMQIYSPLCLAETGWRLLFVKDKSISLSSF